MADGTMPEKMSVEEVGPVEVERPKNWTKQDAYEYGLACVLSDLDYALKCAPNEEAKQAVIVLIERSNNLIDAKHGR